MRGRTLSIAFSILIAGSMISSALGAQMFPFGPQQGDQTVHKNDDQTTPEQSLSQAFPFFDSLHKSLFISNNGLISFGSAFTQYTPAPFPLNRTSLAVIAPFWADIDTRNHPGNVFYRQTTDPNLLRQVTTEIRYAFINLPSFQATWAYIVTWDRVAAYVATRNPSVTNSFQVVLATDGKRSFCIFNYLSVRWIQTGSTPARAGFDAGDGKRFFSIPGSSTPEIANVDVTTNVAIPGRWVLRLDGEEVQVGGCKDDGSVLNVFPRQIFPFAGQYIYISGPCFSKTDIVKCSFNGKITTGHLVNDVTATCPTPHILQSRRVSFKFSRNAGISFDHHIALYIRTSEKDFKVKPRSHIGWVEERSRILDFEDNSFSSSSSVPFVDIHLFMFSHDETKPPQDFILLQNVTNAGNIDVTEALDNLFQKPDKKGKTDAPKKTHDDIRTIGAFAVKASNISNKTAETIYSHYLFIKHKNLLAWSHDALCEEWYGQDIYKYNIPQLMNNAPPCPSLARQARQDRNFEEDNAAVTEFQNYYHRNVAKCYRSRFPTQNNAGQQCCYGFDGNLQNVGDFAQPGGGTFDVVHHNYSPFQHYKEDVWPYIVCCKESTFCHSHYYPRRPSDDSSRYRPPRPAWSGGDPHFTTQDGHRYTFNGQGDYLLYQDLLGTRIECRLVPMDGVAATRISSIALHDSYSSVVEIKARQLGTPSVKVNKTEVNDFDEAPDQEFKGVRIIRNEDDDSITIQLANSTVVLHVKVTYKMMSIRLDLPRSAWNKTKGLLGRWNDDPEDDLTTATDVVLPLNISAADIHSVFGASWKVDNSHLFASPAELTRSFTPRLNPPPSADAEAACQGDTFCLFDFTMTGNSEVALLTLNASAEVNASLAELISVVVCPFLPPPLNGTRSGNNSVEGSSVSFLCDANYDLIGLSIRECLSNGTWSGNDVICERAPVSLPPPVSESSLATEPTLGFNTTVASEPETVTPSDDAKKYRTIGIAAGCSVAALIVCLVNVFVCCRRTKCGSAKLDEEDESDRHVVEMSVRKRID